MYDGTQAYGCRYITNVYIIFQEVKQQYGAEDGIENRNVIG